MSKRYRLPAPFAVALTICWSGAGVAQTIFKNQDGSGAVAFSDMPPGAARTAYRIAPDEPADIAPGTCGRIDALTLDERATAWRERIRATALRHALAPDLLEALVRVESCFDPSAVSVAGAQGLTQLMPATAAELGVSDAFDAEQNLDAGARYLAELLARFGNETLALAAYNAGPGSVERHAGVPPFPETRTYLARIAALRRLP